ncbi:hypothetical protein GRI39_13545 [Altererythrobacter indicus]|uniref:Uncharacterized protein n=1 Tax=Altericroceibacterium indicum TaxID=374177 RepID=A0A845A9J0_9SPHN|nr:DUF5695 domain-containing protein [Altericroceibacterium indicum]MXP27052.1 hypothetical protein [Altericroceibacterium indicum]
MTLSRRFSPLAVLLASVSLTLTAPSAPLFAQEAAAEKPSYPPVQTVPYTVGPFTIALRADTGTLARLSPSAEPGFDFTPADRLAERQYNGFNHIGDLHLRLRSAGGDWQDFNSAHERKQIAALATKGHVFAAYDITASMGANIPLEVTREWADENGALAMYFTLTNTSAAPVEVGALGMPMVFDNIITDRDLEQAHAEASFVDPYIGRDAGYLQVTRLNGKGPSLLVLPENGTPLEAYEPLKNPPEAENIFTDKTQRKQTFEGFYDWTVASKGLAEKEWKDAGRQWNEPTSFTLQPGETRRFGLRMVESPSIRSIEETLIANGRPVAVGVPGYVVPMDSPADLFLNAKQKVSSFTAFPEGALKVTKEGQKGAWQHLKVAATGQWGRARLTIAYADGSKQTVSYYVTKPLAQVNADIGHFTTTRQWFDDPKDPFGRSPAILTYDREAEKIVTQEPRVWISGMSDEGGAGAWVAGMIKQLDNPDPAEVARLEQLVNETVLGNLQVKDGEHKGGVKKSIFYYEPEDFPAGYYDPEADWTSWTSWSKKDAADLGRSYNYPHVAVGHWVLYRLARNHDGLVKQHDWKFYLEWAYQTSVAMMEDAPYYAQFGQMEGDVFLDILKDLKREGMDAEAAHLERLMRERADHWRSLPYPYGSEMAWDSTGQPEVYAWMRYFGYQPEADSTREVILSYDPTVPSWGYNGNARRYWDFLYGGKYPRIERQIHHYGSALNAVPLLEAYRANPKDFHLLRVGFGGIMGGITNIDQDGFGSAAFHAWPDMMKWDPYTGDYGMGYYGHAISAGTYVVNHPRFGWLSFGGDVRKDGKAIAITPKDGARTRLFIAPAGLWVTLDAGKIAAAHYTPATGEVTITLDPATSTTPKARVHVEQTVAGSAAYRLKGGTLERDAYTVNLSANPTEITLTTR